MLPPHLEIEPVRSRASRPPKRQAILTACLVYAAAVWGALWWLRTHLPAFVQPPTKPAVAVQLLLPDPTPPAPKGSGATDPHLAKEDPDPVPDPPMDFTTTPARMPDRPEKASFEPSLPVAPGGDGRVKGRDGAGEGAGDIGIRGNGTVPMRFEDMDILWRVQPEYPLGVELLGEEDAGEVEITIDERGWPISVKPSRFQYPACAKSAERAMKQWRFAPVRIHGALVKATFRMDVNFILPNKTTRR